MTRLLNSVLLGFGLASLAPCSLAQTAKFLEPTRTVFKCEVAGKVTYSDALCRGAQRVDVQPTHGLNKASGTVRVGEDVRVEDTNEAHTNEAITEAIRPIAAMSGDPRAGHQRRFKLSPSVQGRMRTPGSPSTQPGTCRAGVDGPRQGGRPEGPLRVTLAGTGDRMLTCVVGPRPAAPASRRC